MKARIGALLGSQFLQGGILFTLTNFFVGFLNYLFNSLSAKSLGPVGYGEITTLFSYLTITGVPIAVLTTDVVRRLGQKNKKQEAFLAWEQWVVRKISRWKLLFIPYFASVVLLPRLLNMSLAASATLLFLIPASFASAFYIAAFQGFKQFFLAGIIIALPQLIKLAGPLLVLAHLDGLYTILIFLILAGVFSILISRALIRKSVRSKNTSGEVIEKRIIHFFKSKNLIITILSLLGINLLNNLDVIYVKKFFTGQEAGMYGGWSLFAKVIFYVFGSITSLSLVFFSSKEDAKYHFRLLIGIIALILLGGVVSYGGYYYMGNFLVNLLLNSQYSTITQHLPQAALFGTFYTLIFLINIFFLSKNSSFSLITFFAIPFYAIYLLSAGSNIVHIYTVNVHSSLVVSVVYLLALFYYNINLWKSKKKLTS